MSDDPVNPLLGHLTEDARSFSTIARSWAKAAHDLSAVMMNELVNAFWRGEFEHDGKSSVFALHQPDRPHSDRRPGNYATTEDDLIVKVGADLRSYVTAERKRVQIFRRAVAEFLYSREWDGTDDGLLGLATIPVEKWPEDMRKFHKDWRIRRDEFAKWYPFTTLAAEARLEEFWPHVEGLRSAPPKLVESRKGDFPKVEAAVNATYPSGIPKSLATSDIIRAIVPHLKTIGGKVPTDRTLHTHISKMRRNPDS